MKRKFALIAGIVAIVIAGIVMMVYFISPHWSHVRNSPQYGGEPVSGESKYSGDVLVYRSKYLQAKDMLEDAEIDDMGSFLLVVDVSEQREYLFTGSGDFVDMYTVATGSRSVYVGPREDDEKEDEAEDEDMEDEYQDRSMSPSVWRVVSKRESGLAPLYGARLMMLDKLYEGKWIRTEVALHGTNTPEILGTPSSLGCIYHNDADIIALYDIVAIGTYVVAVE